VVEGRLPLKGFSDAPPAQPLQLKHAEAPKGDAPLPEAPLPTLDKPKSNIVGQVKDQQKPQIHLAEARPQPPREDAMPKTATPNAAITAPVHAVTAQPPAVALAQAAAQPQREMIDKTPKLADVDSILSAMPAERHMPATGTLAPVAATAAPETARQASAQIAVAITNSNGKTTEIALNPEELGRVKLSLSAGDSVITVNVLADRPETQDLLRRHIDILAQEFRQLGYTSISFSFGEQKGQARPEAMPDDQPVEPEIQETGPITRATPAPAVTGLDLRI
jgi:flagellar hook-length control protein FliK